MSEATAHVVRVVRHRVTNLTIKGAMVSGRPVIVSVAFGARRESGARSPVALVRALRRWCAALARFLDGHLKDLSGLPIDLRHCTPFQRAVLQSARTISWGSTVSYAELARRAGRPRAVRAAASVMRNNPFPLIVPCHRVVRSGGEIGGFMGSRNGRAIELKRRLLARERVTS